MSRNPRESVGGCYHHALNRGKGRTTDFHKDGDYRTFLKAVRDASDHVPIRVLAFCLMPNHSHLVLWPEHDGDLSRRMHRVQNAYVRRSHAHYRSSDHVWQDWFKAFPVQDDHLSTVIWDVERNPLRASLVARAK